jgi:hypothetical protein
MKRNQLNAVTIGLAWLASLGVVFILGILLAFAMHLGPREGAESQGDLTLDERDLVLTLERYTGEPADIPAVLAQTDSNAIPEQVEQALRAILRERDPDLRRLAALRLVRGLPSRHVMSSIRFLQEIPSDPARDQVLRRFLESWASKDGRSAIAFASSLQSPRDSQLAINAVLRGWSTVRPADAWNWVIERAGNSRRAERWLEVILSNLGSFDRETALMLLNKMPSKSFQTQMSLVVMKQILLSEPPREALNWLGELPRGTEGAAATYLAERWASSEPAAAAEWLHDSFPAEIEGLDTVLREWVYASPRQAADWVWETFSGNDRHSLMDVVAEEWIANDGPTPLAQWLNNRGADQTLDGAVEALALATAEVDPATALVWAQSVIDPNTRSMLEILIGREWIRVSPDEAEENLPLLLESETARAALLEAEPVYEEEPASSIQGDLAIPMDEHFLPSQ